MSTCTDLINAINAIVEPPNFSDLAPSCATLSLTSTESLVQLTASGDAVLSAPSSSVSGRPFTVKIAGNYPATTGTDPNIYFAIYFGSSISGPNNICSGGFGNSGGNTAVGFSAEIKGTWDATSQYVMFYGTSIIGDGTGHNVLHPSVGGNGIFAASSYSALQFCVSGQATNYTGSPALTLTEFSIQFD